MHLIILTYVIVLREWKASLPCYTDVEAVLSSTDWITYLTHDRKRNSAGQGTNMYDDHYSGLVSMFGNSNFTAFDNASALKSTVDERHFLLNEKHLKQGYTPFRHCIWPNRDLLILWYSHFIMSLWISRISISYHVIINYCSVNISFRSCL